MHIYIYSSIYIHIIFVNIYTYTLRSKHTSQIVVSIYVYIHIYVNIYTYTLRSKHIPQIVGKDHKLADEDVSSYKHPYISAKETYISVHRKIPIFPQKRPTFLFLQRSLNFRKRVFCGNTQIPIFPHKRLTFQFIQRSLYFRKRDLHPVHTKIPIFPQKSPTFPPQSSIFLQKRLVLPIFPHVLSALIRIC